MLHSISVKRCKGKRGCGREKARDGLTSELLRSLCVRLTACDLFRVLPFLKAPAMGIRFHHKLLMGTNHIKIIDKHHLFEEAAPWNWPTSCENSRLHLCSDQGCSNERLALKQLWGMNAKYSKGRRDGLPKTHCWSQTRMRSTGGQPGTG